jgi:hypothetical protein
MSSSGLVPGGGSGRSGRLPVDAHVSSSFSESDESNRCSRIQILNRISVSSLSIRFLSLVAIGVSRFWRARVTWEQRDSNEPETRFQDSKIEIRRSIIPCSKERSKRS